MKAPIFVIKTKLSFSQLFFKREMGRELVLEETQRERRKLCEVHKFSN